jgi:replicative DNA helicase
MGQVKKPPYRSLVHTPAELSQAYVAWAERIQDVPGVTFGIPSIDKYVIPFHPGDLVCFVGRPGMGKTSMLAYLAKAQAARIRAAGNEEREVVVYVTWESSAEEITNFLLTDGTYSVSDVAWGRVNLEDVKRKAVGLVREPIWVIGHGIGRAGQAAIRMTPEIVYEAIQTMEADFGVKPTLLLFDYLQLIPSKTAAERVQQVTEAAIRIKELAKMIGTPAVAAVQAHRRVDEYKIKLPELIDAQWSSAIEQTVDKFFGIWRPAVSEGTQTLSGQPVFIEMKDGQVYQVVETLMFLQMCKQRFDKSRHLWPLYFDPAYLKLAEIELRELQRDGDLQF